MFKLKNGKEIDWQNLIKAMEDRISANVYFLDLKTGKIKKFIKVNKATFIKIPKIDKGKIHRWMEEYTDQFIKYGDPELAKKVYPILKQIDVLDKFEETLEKESDDGEIHGWTQSKFNYLGEEMEEWLFGLNIGITDDWEYDDGCVICQEMKKADEDGHNLSELELKKAFAKAKKEGVIVGGFEKDKTKSIN